MIFHSLKDKEQLIMVGMMSGTSMDGLDICVAEIGFASMSVDVNLLASDSIPYSEELREKVSNCQKGNAELISQTHFNLGRFMANETKNFLKKNKISIVDAIAMHGQTIFHSNRESSFQIGEPSFISQELDVPVISNFRAADISVGGTGAPLIPIIDKWLFQEEDIGIICLNLGGIANVSFIPASKLDKPILGFDTGPGMALMDEVMLRLRGEYFDRDGARCLIGKSDDRDVEKWMEHYFINALPPKSTGRDIFGPSWIEENIPNLDLINLNDLMATLSLFSAKSIAYNCKRFLPMDLINRVIISGGGIYNKGLINNIEKEFSPISVISSDYYGFDPFMKEALGFAILGVANLKGIPANVPTVTGAKKSVILGKITI
ncbi:MAG: hypothetical protein CMG75_05525 [Candidatus Marinimicrobia bacterium]|nr:hypothetical protein [Candidatus Neomarinimicrobiota bacterium]